MNGGKLVTINGWRLLERNGQIHGKISVIVKK